MSLPARHHGYLRIELGCDSGRTVITRQRSRPPLQTFGLQDADRYGGGYLQIINPCGGLFEGDTAEVEVSLQRAAHLYLTTQAATKVYPTEHGEVTRQHVRFRVACGAILEYFPQPLMPFARAMYAQETSVQVESGGVCLVAEVLAPGRVARGERFAYHMVRSRVEGWVDDRLALLGVLDGKAYLATLYVLTSQGFDPWIPGWNRRLTEQYGECLGITALAHGGLMARLLGQTGQEMLRRLDVVHRLIRQEGLGLPPLQVYRPFA
jgi:urease accessory protein